MTMVSLAGVRSRVCCLESRGRTQRMIVTLVSLGLLAAEFGCANPVSGNPVEPDTVEVNLTASTRHNKGADAEDTSQLDVASSSALRAYGYGPDAGVETGEDAIVPFTPGQPLRLPSRQWRYIPFPSTACRDGSSTGLAVNANPRSDKLLLYLEQGGACFNDMTCLINPVHWSGLDMLDPTNLINSRTGVLSRTDADNPFAEWNMVFVPHCTGDAHMGTARSGYQGQPQVGYLNLTEFLKRIVPSFPDVTQVVLSGTSSGGFGAAYNWMRVQDAFGSIPVHLLDDSGPPIGEELVAPCVQKKLTQLWGLVASLHPACTECDVRGGHLVSQMLEASMRRLAGERRAAILTNDEDATMRLFFGYALNDCENFNDLLPPDMALGTYPRALERLRRSLQAYDNFAMYLVKGDDHVMLDKLGEISSAGVALPDFLRAFATGGDAFVSVIP